MLDVLREIGSRWGVVGSDIQPRRDDVVRCDFLSDSPPGDLRFAAEHGRVDAIITNPPFNLAPQMIEHAMSYRPCFVAFLLKSTFWQAARRRPLFLSHQPSAIHPLLWRPDFLGLGAPTMEVSWVVWDRSSFRGVTSYEPLTKPA
ncbi:hypothetical protein [Falsiroseomonas sp. CW058]|uniref:hypothetical protein n=1 Tax=Falsiroseomonas sp. CW058 TaxID=3388664 RepID=UPI003D3115A4